MHEKNLTKFYKCLGGAQAFPRILICATFKLVQSCATFNVRDFQTYFRLARHLMRAIIFVKCRAKICATFFARDFLAFKEPDKWESVIGFEPVFPSFVLFCFWASYVVGFGVVDLFFLRRDLFLCVESAIVLASCTVCSF